MSILDSIKKSFKKEVHPKVWAIVLTGEKNDKVFTRVEIQHGYDFQEALTKAKDGFYATHGIKGELSVYDTISLPELLAEYHAESKALENLSL